MVTATRSLHGATLPTQISWGAILCGCALSLIAYLLFSVFGTALGTSSLDPGTGDDSLAGFSIGAAAVFGVASVVAIGLGAFVAGRAAPALGGLHGVISWAVTTLVTTFLLASVVTGITGTAFNLLGSGLSAAGQGVAAAAPAVAGKAKQALDDNGVKLDWNDLSGQLDTLLRQTGKSELDPERLNDQARNSAKAAADDTRQTAANPQQADETLGQWFKRVREQGAQALDAADKQALVNIIQARTGKSQAEARQIADRYEKTYNQAMAKYAQLKQQAEAQAKQAAAKTAAAVSKAAWVTLAILIVGGLIAYAGGTAGQRRRQAAYEPI
ncbi:hypothetical protein [Salinisphaera sp. T31B1]|uniref:hypothetical protein n=1 Tax=Salinisphaera sp. T31B1 TaxID=727963 RepID=UPI003340CE80